ncbi:hypothetical protein DT019_03225 [Streptomyces sp. SDr-06]|uniref:DUF6551 family protein n=1 Tax=Streptomyces sp. SDr-06 TaxID=2267702 RepID=UPI000DEC0118|nr:DUF6551 family protein [Streptomyces sp. SDr-06]RCH70516.1 hypothetical protein DT019_03225 [Streptomyces sp. SDr-06]
MVLASIPAARLETASIEWLSPADITRDPRVNTRPVDSAWVERKAREGFDLTRLGVPVVSRRASGEQVWLDGQNRGELLRKAGWPTRKIECKVFTGLTLQQEAALFLGLNDGRQVKAVYKFLGRVTAGEADAVAISAIATSLGWRISDQAGSTSITAVKSLERLFHGERAQNPAMAPGRALTLTLRIVTEAWGYKSEAVNGDVLLGIGSIFNRFGEVVELPALIKKLAEFPAGPSGLLGKARGARDFKGGTVAHCVSEIVVRAYNTRRRAGSLPDWR